MEIVAQEPARTPRHNASATVRTVSRRSGNPRRHHIRWRSQRIKCCGKELAHIDATDAAADPPVADFDPHSDGGIVAAHWQCGDCGSLRHAEVRRAGVAGYRGLI